jgi:hypothetical protein
MAESSKKESSSSSVVWILWMAEIGAGQGDEGMWATWG